MLRDKIKKLIEKGIKELQGQNKLPEFRIPEISVECPEKESCGDYSANISLRIAKIAKKNPMEIAGLIKDSISQPIFSKVETAKPGFINFFISENYLKEQVKTILKQKRQFGSLKIGKKEKVNVEFISANPTGPLTLGNGRGGFSGDVLANVLEKAGYRAEREYYINDTGGQVKKLGDSIVGKEIFYKGEYINDLKKQIKEKDPAIVGQRAVAIILKDMIKPLVKKMGVKYDIWFSERSLDKNKEIDKILELLKKKGLTYKKEEALWFKTTRFGDDKDRVLIKADKEKTYFASDVAYLKNKFDRGFKKLIIIWGADHYGYIRRIKAAAKALGYKKEQIDVIIMQMVRLLEKGKEVKMSKRAGIFVTLDELINEVGLDAARFFFLMRGADSHLNFDLDLAKKKSADNPVYYVQYAYARICSIFRKGKTEVMEIKGELELNEKEEFDLIRHLIKFPEIIEDTAEDYQVQRIPQYAVELADSFHHFYEKCRVVSEDKKITQARLNLILAVKIVLKNVLDLMAISAPEKM